MFQLKGKILDFYKERAQQYYDGHVEEISFNLVGDILRRRTNLLVKRQTLGKVPEYLRGGSLGLRPPLAAFSANIFQVLPPLLPYCVVLYASLNITYSCIVAANFTLYNCSKWISLTRIY